MKSLIIAEKPSVARDLANVLGKVPKKGEFYENDRYVISSAVGHLVELYMPEDYDKKLKAWSPKTLPIIPEQFGVKPIEKTKKKFDELKKLLKRKDIDEVINACDAGREGELIFTYIYELTGSKLPRKRLWMTSMTPDAIREAFGHLREQSIMKPLQDAARCRSESDWLVGINGTRIFTTRMFGMRGGGKVASVGRVQTPTLAMIVEREKAIRDFVSRPYWKLSVEFSVKNGDYVGVYQRPDFSKKDKEDTQDRADRIWDKAVADQVAESISQGEKADVSDESKRTKQNCPLLYDLTSLQREANQRYGFPATMTLSVAQSLYEKHKVITYPRTDSRALPEDYLGVCRETLGALGGENRAFAAHVLKNDWVKPNKRIFDNKKISDHFAIIPTKLSADKLDDKEQRIYDLIAKRFVAIFYPAAEFDVTVRTSKIREHEFKTEGKVLVVPGYLAVYGKEETETMLPLLSPSDENKAGVKEVYLEELKTNPPPRYTEATLLAAMEGAGKLVEDEELALAMKEKGLGTPATRAQTIENLLHMQYIERDNKELRPFPKAEQLIDYLQAIGVAVLTSPSLTGEWEYKLRQIEEGKLSRDAFMQEIAGLTTVVVKQASDFQENMEEATPTDLISPVNGEALVETLRTYQTKDGSFKVYKNIGNRIMEKEEVRELIANRRIGPLTGFRSKLGKPYNASLVLDEENKVKFEFEKRETDGGQTVDDGSMRELIGRYKDEADIVETGAAYRVISKKSGEDKEIFRIGKKLLGKELTRENALKLIQEGKTELIQGFKSNKTGKLFDAFLIIRPGWKMGWEFPPREPKAKAGADGKKPAAKGTAKFKKPTAGKTTEIKGKKTKNAIGDDPF